MPGETSRAYVPPAAFNEVLEEATEAACSLKDLASEAQDAAADRLLGGFMRAYLATQTPEPEEG